MKLPGRVRNQHIVATIIPALCIQILSFVFLFYSQVRGQTFEKLYISDEDEIVYDAVIVDSSTCIFALNQGNFETDSYITEIFKIDLNTGLFLDSLLVEPVLQNYYFRGIFDFLKLSDTLYIGIGKLNNDTGDDEIQYIVHVNNYLEITFETISNIPEILEENQKTILSDDNLLVTVGREKNSEFKILSEKTIFGDLIRFQKYSYSTSYTATAVIDLQDINKYHLYFFLGSLHSFFIINKEDLDVDSIIEYTPLFRAIDGIVDPNNTSFYYIAGKQAIPNSEHNDLSFLKVNTSGTFTQFTYPTDQNIYYTYKCLSPSANFLYFSGVYPFTQSAPFLLYPEQRWIMLYKLNNDGSIVWQKFYKGEVNYMAIKVLATYDGGALIFSTRYDWNDPIPNQRDVHILKIDSTGYYDPLTGTEEELQQMNKQILVYPKPADNVVNFVLGLYSNLQLSIYNSTGERKLLQSLPSSQTIDVSGLPAGIYIYLLTGKNGFKETGKIIKH